uniref:Uncharacterized protein n=1 Tax=Oryza rufipogon TaxID=4529 RepID=A0A0E0RFP3_ORYRU
MKDLNFAIQVAVTHYYHIFYDGCLTNFDIGDHGAEATLLYPELASINQILSRYENSITPCLMVFVLYASQFKYTLFYHQVDRGTWKVQMKLNYHVHVQTCFRTLRGLKYGYPVSNSNVQSSHSAQCSV